MNCIRIPILNISLLAQCLRPVHIFISIPNYRSRSVSNLCVFLFLFLFPIILSAQVTNDDLINYRAEIYRLKWNVNTEGGNEEPTWRFRWRTTSAYTTSNTTCSNDHFSSHNWCYAGTDLNNNYPVKLIYAHHSRSASEVVYTANFAHEDDGGSRCSSGVGDDEGHCSYRQFTAKGGSPGLYRSINYTGFQSKSEGTIRMAWRYTSGNHLNQALNFGTPNHAQWLGHTNSNRATPATAQSNLGYGNSRGTSSPDVYYSFTIPAARQVTATTEYGSTSFDQVVRLLDANGNEIAEDGINSSANYGRIIKNLCAGTYYVVVEGNGSATGDFTLYIRTNNITNTSAGTIALNGSQIVPVPQEEEHGQLNSSVNAYLLNINNDAAISWETRIPTGTWETIPDATTQSYQLPELTENKEFRRVATGSCGQVEYSNVIAIETVQPNGILRGRVVSPTSAGVIDVTVCASRNIAVPGSPQGYEYCVETENDGTYRIENIYYGVDTEGAEFTITPSKVDPSGLVHVFDPTNTIRILKATIPTENDINFTDETVYSVTGTITQMQDGVSCPVADVEILVNGQFLGNKTDAEGKYALTMGEPDDYTIEPRYENHSFTPTPPTLYVDTNIEDIDFTDTETRTLSGYLRADCEIYIGQSILNIFDADNCFVKSIMTNEGSGYYEVELPARPYSVQVTDFTIKDSWELIDHKDEVINFFSTEEVDLTTENQTLDFVYHHPPILRIVGLPELDNCGYANPILEQNETYPLEFKVWQVEPGAAIQLGCPVLDGMVTITDLISEIGPDPQEFAIVDGKVDYDLITGNPNIIAPHLKNISAVAKDGFINFDRPDNVLQDVLVTGARPRDLTFTTVSPQVPLMILRDPPGDGSSSFFEESSTFETALSFYTLQNAEASIWSEIKAGTKFQAGLGVSTETEIWGNIGSSIGVSSTSVKASEFVISMTTTERFSTSDNPDITGAEGDVFIGAALNLLYAIADEVNFDFENCGVETDKSLIIGTEDDAFATRYIYTEDHIRNTLIPQLELLESLSTGADAREYANQILIWEQTLQRNEDLKAAATFSENVSFSAGAPYSSETNFTTQSTSAIEFALEINSTISAELGVEVGGNGSSGGSEISVRLETGGSITSTALQSMTTAYTLADDDQGDFFSVDIKSDPVYKTPVFKHVASTTSCPAEPDSQPRDDLQLNVNNPIITGINVGEEGEFTLRLGNTSQSEETRTYALRFVQASNPDGAAITVGGSPYIAPIEYTIGYLGEINVLVKVAQGADNVFSYEGLTFELYPVCDENIMATTTISAFFDSPCSEVTLAEPYDDWVISQPNNNEIQLKITDYDPNDLDEINVQYSLVGLNSWATAMTLLPADLSDPQFGTTLTWNVANSSLEDGDYQIRLQLKCGLASVYSQRAIGIIDRQAPEMVGVPEPANDVYSDGSEIAAYFSEPIAVATNKSGNPAYLQRITDDAIFLAETQMEDNKMIITTNAIDLTTQAGVPFKVHIPTVSDRFNNQKEEALEWNFMIDETTQTGALPLELLSFKGYATDRFNSINWETTHESEVDYYIIERSDNGVDFEPLAEVFATNQKDLNRYEWLDEQPLTIGYYRLQNVGAVGKSTYLPSILIKQATIPTQTGITKLYPNPTDGLINLEFMAATTTSVHVQVFDVAGQLMLQQQLTAQNGVNQQQLELHGLTAGAYFLELQYGNGQREQRKLVVK